MTLDITTLTNLLENVLEPYIELLTFGIDIAAGIVIGVSAIIALTSFLKILTKSSLEQIHEKEK